MFPSSDVFQSPITDIVVAYFPKDFPHTEKDKAAAKLQDVLAKSFGTYSDVEKIAHGWGIENDFPVKGKKAVDGQPGAALMGFVGWANESAQADFHQTATYNEAVAQIHEMSGLVGLNIVTLRCQHLERLEE